MKANYYSSSFTFDPRVITKDLLKSLGLINPLETYEKYGEEARVILCSLKFMFLHSLLDESSYVSKTAAKDLIECIKKNYPNFDFDSFLYYIEPHDDNVAISADKNNYATIEFDLNRGEVDFFLGAIENRDDQELFATCLAERLTDKMLEITAKATKTAPIFTHKSKSADSGLAAQITQSPKA